MTTTARIGPMPQLGYGTWQRRDQECLTCVTAALETGYRHIDTAQGYDNEAEVGRAIADSGLSRQDIFITTKVKPENFGAGMMMPSVHESLEKLRVDQVDLLLLHWPSPHDEYPVETYVGQLAEVYDAGLAAHIGVSNFTRRYLDAALDLLGDRPVTTNQCEIHVYLQNRSIVDYSASRGIPMTAYCPMARGRIKGDPVLEEIATAHGASVGQIALAFLLHEGHVAIPSSSSPARIAENFAALDISLTPDEMTRLRGLDRGERLVNGAWVPVWDD